VRIMLWLMIIVQNMFLILAIWLGMFVCWNLCKRLCYKWFLDEIVGFVNIGKLMMISWIWRWNLSYEMFWMLFWTMLTLGEVCKTILDQIGSKMGFWRDLGGFPKRVPKILSSQEQGARLANRCCAMASECGTPLVVLHSLTS